jgi:hypothetical protein
MQSLYFKPSFTGVAYGETNNEERHPILKFGNTCCSLCTLSIKNYHTMAEIKEVIDSIKEISLSQPWHPNNRQGGERNIQVVCSPGEEELEKNLKKLKFKLIHNQMPRRIGYPGGRLKLYLLTF